MRSLLFEQAGRLGKGRALLHEGIPAIPTVFRPSPPSISRNFSNYFSNLPFLISSFLYPRARAPRKAHCEIPGSEVTFLPRQLLPFPVRNASAPSGTTRTEFRGNWCCCSHSAPRTGVVCLKSPRKFRFHEGSPKVFRPADNERRGLMAGSLGWYHLHHRSVGNDGDTTKELDPSTKGASTACAAWKEEGGRRGEES